MKRDTNIADVVKLRVQSFNSLAAESHLTLETKIEDGIPTLLLDDNKIGQVLNNFLSNSIKFTKEGKITVSAFVLKKGENLVAKVASLGMIWPGIKDLTADADKLVLGVTDTGIGIAEDQISKLFNKFTQLEQTAMAEKKGTGLGLVITKGIIEAHGGTVGIFSKIDKGSTFYCFLPVK
jgi:signal transduction histidine kinase